MKEEERIVQEIKSDLTKNADEKYYENTEESREKITAHGAAHHGLKTWLTRQISSKYFSKIKKKSKKEIFALCELLLKSGYSEERTIAFDWAFRLRRRYTSDDFSLLESWLKTYVTGWGSCDDFCTHAFGEFLYQFPEFISNVKKWTDSENRWLRRASAVVLIYSIRRNKSVEEGFEIADMLLPDENDMVQKGYGWMLKEISNLYPKRVFEYVMARRERMPRTSLRYAIEKLSPDLRKRAMEKN